LDRQDMTANNRMHANRRPLLMEPRRELVIH
jgi:hypothetical protein